MKASRKAYYLLAWSPTLRTLVGAGNLARCTSQFSHDDFTLASAVDPRSGSESKEEQAAAGSEASASLVAGGKGKRHAGLASLGPQPPLKKICHNITTTTTVVREAWLGQELVTMSSGAGTVDLTLPLTPTSPKDTHNLPSPPSPSHNLPSPSHNLPSPSHNVPSPFSLSHNFPSLPSPSHNLPSPHSPSHNFPSLPSPSHNLPSPPTHNPQHDLPPASPSPNPNPASPTRPVTELRLTSPTVTSPSRSSHDHSLTSPSLSSSSIGPSPSDTPTSSSSVSPVHGRCVGAFGPAPSSGMESTEEGHGSAKTRRRRRNRRNKKLKKRQEQERLQEGLTEDPGSQPSCPDSSVSEAGAAGGVAGLGQESSECESFSGAASKGVKEEEEMSSESEGEQMSGGQRDVTADFSSFLGETFSPSADSFLRNDIARAGFPKPLVNGYHREEEEEEEPIAIGVEESDLIRSAVGEYGVGGFGIGGEMMGGFGVGGGELPRFGIGSEVSVGSDLGVVGAGIDMGLGGGFGAEGREGGERDEMLRPGETKDEQVEDEREEGAAERVEMIAGGEGEEKEEVEGEGVGKEEVEGAGKGSGEVECEEGEEEGRQAEIKEREGENKTEGEREGVMTDDRVESGDGGIESGHLVSRHESEEAGEDLDGEISCVPAVAITRTSPDELMAQVIINNNLEDLNEFQSARVVDQIEATDDGDEAIDIVEVTDVVESREGDLDDDGDKEEKLIKTGVDEEETKEDDGVDMKIKVEESEEKEVVIREEKYDNDDQEVKEKEIKQEEAMERERDVIDEQEEGKKEEEEDVALPVSAPTSHTNGFVGPQEDDDVKMKVGTTWRDESYPGEKMEVVEVLEGGEADIVVCEVTSEAKVEEEVERVVGEIVSKVEGEKEEEDEEGVREVGEEMSRDPGFEVVGGRIEDRKEELEGEIEDSKDRDSKEESLAVDKSEVVGAEPEDTKVELEAENRVVDDFEVRDSYKYEAEIEEKKKDGFEVEGSFGVGEGKGGFEASEETGFEVVTGKDGVEAQTRHDPEAEDKTSVPGGVSEKEEQEKEEVVMVESAMREEDDTRQDTEAPPSLPTPPGTITTSANTTLDEGQTTGETTVALMTSSPEQHEGYTTPAATTTTDTSPSSTDNNTDTIMPHDTAAPTEAEAAAGDTVNAALASFEELDNIPDGVCESGEVEEEEEDEDEWSYYRMEPQTHTQGEDELVGGVNSEDTNLVKETTSPADHSPQHDLLSHPGQSESLVQDIHTTQEESFREDFLSREGKDITGEAKLLDFEYQPLKEEMDTYPHDNITPMEADQPPVLDRSPDILQASMDNVPEPEISFDIMGKPEMSSDKMRDFESGGGMPDFLDHPAEPSSPHATGSPQMPGSPRSVEGFVTSVELNTPDASLGTNFNINQTQDVNGSGMDQPSGPFSVYVSSSPEPLSMEPSTLPQADLSNVSEVSNGHVEEEGKRPQSGDFSPVEIVHAQSTVEVVAPPSPGEKLETEMDFVIPEHTPDLMTSSQILSDQPSDITFIPEPAIQPVAEIPVPVYLEGTTPVSEVDDQISESLSTKEDVSESEKLLESPVANMTISPPPAAFEPEIIQTNQEEVNTVPQENMEVVAPVNNGIDIKETPAPLQGETVSPVINEVTEIEKVSEPVVSSEKINNEVAAMISTTKAIASPGPEKKTKVPEAKPTAMKSPSKTAKTPVRSSLDKAGKTTAASDTARKTPVSKTPTRTPLAKSTEKKTLLSKTDSKPSPTKTTDKPSASRLTAKPASATKPSTTKPATAKPAAPKSTTARPAPRTTTTSRATTSSTLSSTTKPTERKVPKPPTPTAPRAALSKPSSAANKPTAPRPTPATRTTQPMKRPGTAPVKSATDKANTGKVNGTSTTRPTARPGTASTTTTATRKPLTTTTRPTTKPTAEKETKNTTNRILSTTRSAPKSTIGVTKTASKTSTMAGRSTVTESKTTSRVNGTTSTTTTKSRVTTKSVAAKATDVAGKKGVGSKLKSAPITKTSPGKAAAIIEASGATTVVNGENKIAHEETSVEVVEKCAAEDTVMTEKVLDEALSSATTTTQVITTETTEVIVNGDH
ncbi:hypothetical protein Pcinc_016371 [Petrolisthes cinctipes]|uniref:Uncharacterized protein n=1 Tax=Petrolisthes cinctipes TaxID=88211 RepID=A0AAE1FR82_PETCI|nr:hypothetical protein Pcinc_016371 [Petrolisthes cinctipes]